MVRLSCAWMSAIPAESFALHVVNLVVISLWLWNDVGIFVNDGCRVQGIELD